ncbi:ABC transporter permease [Thermotoga sp. KOL6]|uniref:ABC transporter permease n=1 Tax=Thermotoga sp. KOL6 TaxID=126741 RepID=UPI000C78F2A2|nr:ABC transporter permease [Thermotoga sp. KOL6]PLV59045.1 ABC transporter [Thermotoga sp. KOL6]
MTEKNKLGSKIKLSTQMVLALVVVALWIFLAIATPRFLTYDNIKNIMRQMTIQGILGIAAVVVIVTGGIDLSVGSVVALVNIVLSLMVSKGANIGSSILYCLLLSALIGFTNGLMVYDLKLPPFIATLGMMSIARGVTLLISNGRNVFGLPRSLADFANSDSLGIPLFFWLLLLVVVGIEVIFRFTKLGRYLFALGSNIEAARLSGVNIRIVTYAAYILASVLAGFAGILETARLWMGVPTTGTGYELDAIAAAVIGGASLSGAEGSALGAFFGALVMTTIYNGSVHLNVNPFWQRVLVGIIVVAAVGVDQLRKSRQ